MKKIKMGKNEKGKYFLSYKGRAVKYGRLSDEKIGEYFKYTLEYFDYRCAFSGEQFVEYDEEPIAKYKSNQSVDHIVALATGGHDIYPNIVPCVLQYNLNKNKKYLLDFLFTQRNLNGEVLYSPYRMVKLANYIIKSLEARNAGMMPEEYAEHLLSEDFISVYLKNIEKEDVETGLHHNTKIYSSDITTTSDLTKESRLESINGIKINIKMDMLIGDILSLLKADSRINQEVVSNLEERSKSIFNTFEREMYIRGKVLESLNKLNILNKYTVAFFLTQKLKHFHKGEINNDLVEQYIKDKLELLSNIGIKNVKRFIENTPDVLTNDRVIRRLNIIKLLRPYYIEKVEKIDTIDDFVDVLLLLKKHDINIRNIPKKGNIENFLRQSGIRDEEKVRKIMSEVKLITGKENYNIGTTFDHIQQRNKEEFMDRMLQAKDENGTELISNEEMEFLAWGKSSVDALIGVLILLKKNGISLTDRIRKDDTISSILKKDNVLPIEQIESIENEARLITNENDYNIGSRYRTQRMDNHTAFVDKMLSAKDENGDCVFNKEEIEYFTQSQKSHMPVQDLARTIIILKKHRIKISDIRLRDSVEQYLDKIQAPEKESIITEISEVTGKKDYRIGKEISRNKIAYEELKSEIKLLDEEEIIDFDELDKLFFQKNSKGAREDLVDILSVLKENGIDVTMIKRSDTISSLLHKSQKEAEETDTIFDMISKMTYENDFKIGERLAEQRRKRNATSFRDSLSNAVNDEGKDIFDELDIEYLVPSIHMEKE